MCVSLILILFSFSYSLTGFLLTGQSGLGKSTLMNTLFKSKVSRKSVLATAQEKIPKTIEIKSISHGTALLNPLVFSLCPFFFGLFLSICRCVSQNTSISYVTLFFYSVLYLHFPSVFTLFPLSVIVKSSHSKHKLNSCFRKCYTNYPLT